MTYSVSFLPQINIHDDKHPSYLECTCEWARILRLRRNEKDANGMSMDDFRFKILTDEQKPILEFYSLAKSELGETATDEDVKEYVHDKLQQRIANMESVIYEAKVRLQTCIIHGNEIFHSLDELRQKRMKALDKKYKVGPDKKDDPSVPRPSKQTKSQRERMIEAVMKFQGKTREEAEEFFKKPAPMAQNPNRED